MKIRIEGDPGELEARLSEVLEYIRELGGGELRKALPDGEIAPLPFPAMEELVARARRKHAERIQRIVQKKIGEVILAARKV